MVVVNVVEFTKETLLKSTPLILALAPETKPVPVIVIKVPPKVEPLAGDTEATVGPVNI